jgi:protocatechuate 3,4-dioxygenase beta subunit
MKALASYPDPFEDVSGSSCDVTCQMTLGPCHDDQAPEREDISEGKGGLPMRFALRILDDTCKPVTDADVDIWHCDAEGVYSSETADQPDFCTGDNAAALAARFFRGHRMTDNNGVVWFNTCFPGWYSGRAIHVHFTVRRSNRSGDEYLTSQVAFPTSLITEICTKHSEYSARGEPNTPNTSDTVFPSASVDSYTVSAEKMSDGALLAWKTVIIRSSLSSSVCSAGGSSGPGMGGAPPSRP